MGEKDKRIRREDNKYRKGTGGTENREKEKGGGEEGVGSDWRKEDSLASSRMDKRSASRASSWRSEGGDSEAFGDVEVKRIRKLVPRNRREKKDNIIIKGLKTEERVSNVWGERCIKENLDLSVRVKSCRSSRNVIVIGLEDSETKRVIMSNKSKLKGKSIFIEHDLT